MMNEVSENPPSAKRGYTPKEFGALFGRSATWAYRRIYSGAVFTIGSAGNYCIPLEEVDRFAGNVRAHNGQRSGRGRHAKTIK